MEYKKDIKDEGLMSQGSSSNSMTVFGVTLSKKCERLATAIYLVTNFLSDTEPMKFRLRALSLDFVRDASFVKNGSQVVEVNVLESLRVNILETLSLLELAFIAGLVSEMNFTILKREYSSLRDMIEVKKISRESRTDSILGDNFFRLAESGPDYENTKGQTSIPSLGGHFHKGHSIGQTITTMSDRNSNGHTSALKGQVSANLIQKPDLYLSKPVPRATTDIAKEARRTRILKLVKDNREVTIKDIATHFSDLSEKTIQRELVGLVEAGVLKKFGERRWSHYTFA